MGVRLRESERVSCSNVRFERLDGREADFITFAGCAAVVYRGGGGAGTS